MSGITRNVEPTDRTMFQLIGGIVLCFGFLSSVAISEAGAKTFSTSQHIKITGKEFQIFIAKLPPKNALKKVTKGKKIRLPVFVFVPGFLGSKLILEKEEKAEEVVWGCVKNVILVKPAINYDMNPKLKAKPLLGPNSPSNDCSFKVYEDFFVSMGYSGLVTEETFLNFAYDWRQDNRLSAEKFDQYIRKYGSVLNGREVVFIAHSMGGLVFKWWYFEHYLKSKNVYKFNIAKIYFVGTPHSGSFAAAYALKHGYRLLAKAGTFLGWVEGKIAPGLNKYGLTFPSFYQLLPYETDDDKPFRAKFMPSVGQSGREMRIDLMTVRAWRALEWPNTKKIDLPPKTTRDQFYYNRLGPMLTSSREFHQFLAARGPIDKARYVFSVRHKTPNGLKARKRTSSQGLSANFDFDEKAGDGTVFTDSAKNFRKKVSSDHMIWVDNEHADLIVDENFIDRIFELRTNLAGGWENIAQDLEDNDSVIELFANRGVLLPATGAEKTWSKLQQSKFVCASGGLLASQYCGMIPFGAATGSRRTAVISVNKKLDAISSFNAKVLYRMAKKRGVPVGTLSGQLYASAKAETDPEFRKERYLSYIGVEHFLLPQNDGNLINYGWAHNNLGSLLLQRGEAGYAQFPLNNATEIVKGVRKTGRNIYKLEGKSSRNLGLVHRALKPTL